MSMQFPARIVAHAPEVIVGHLEEILVNWLSFSHSEDRKGFACTLLDDFGVLLMPTLFIGEIRPERAAKYAFFSLEKVLRLGDHHSHITSFESAVEAIAGTHTTDQRYGGAVRIQGLLRVGISGLPWEDDQAVACALLGRMSIFTDDFAVEIFQRTKSARAARFIEHDRKERARLAPAHE